LFFNLSR
jgi:hypothetical protein